MYHDIKCINSSFRRLSLEEMDKITLGKRSNCVLRADKLQSEGIFMPEIHDAVRECILRYK